MSHSTNWKAFWDEKSDAAESDFDFDRGAKRREAGLEDLAQRELLQFIDPRPDEVILDAGCGTGANMQLLCSKVKRIVAMDYSQGAVERCRRRIHTSGISNVEVYKGSIIDVPSANRSVDKVLCMSVLQYVDDQGVQRAFAEFRRILKDRGILVLHVKNLSSIYLSTLWLGKQIKLFFGREAKVCHYRSYGWYAKKLRSTGFEIIDYNSFNLCILPKMPKQMVLFLQRLELRNYKNRFFRSGLVRRFGSDLKIKAALRKSAAAS
jgi:ubiquinone/menaquinone biosynthesis C-methylase UbiE